MAEHGLDITRAPTIQWQWIPVKPLALDEPLPEAAFTDTDMFRTVCVPESERQAFSFSFPHLARQTPDLHFYRLVQLLNTPLLCLDSRDLGRSDFAYWRGIRPHTTMRHNYVYFWFFRDRHDDDLLVAEYGFDGGFTLRSEKKPPDQLAVFYREICQYISAL